MSFKNGKFDLLKSVEKQEVTFSSDVITPNKFTEQVPKSNQPKGFFDSIKGFFGR